MAGPRELSDHPDNEQVVEFGTLILTRNGKPHASNEPSNDADQFCQIHDRADRGRSP